MSVYNIKVLKASLYNFRTAKDGLLAQHTGDEVETVKIRSIIEDGLILKVGNGESILFWHDRWCDGGPLKVVFPRLFSISSQKNCFISQMGYWQEGSWKWCLSWRRTLFDWEIMMP